MSSLSNMFKSLRHKGQISAEQCDELLNKLKGHDEHLLSNAVNVVRCCECKYYEKADGKHRCQIWQVFREQASPPRDGYCHCGKKKGMKNGKINTIAPLYNFEQQVNTSLCIQDELNKWRKTSDEE